MTVGDRSQGHEERMEEGTEERSSTTQHDFAVENGEMNSEASVISSAQSMGDLLRRSHLYAFLILLLGGGAAVAFLFVGIQGANREQLDHFAGYTNEVVEAIERTFEKYKVAGLLVHQACRNGISRLEFRELYEHLTSTGLEFQVTSFNINTTTDERQALEEESAGFYAEFYPEIVYQGIKGLEPDADGAGVSVQNRSIQPFYFPVHYLEPVEGNQGAIDFDLYSSAARRITIHKVLDTWEPALTPRLSLVQESVEGMFGVILMHPGTRLSTNPGLVPRDFSSMVVRIPDLLAAATKNNEQASSLFIYDSTGQDMEPEFLGGVHIAVHEEKTLSHQTEQSYTSTIASAETRMAVRQISIATREWTIVVISGPETFEAKLIFIRLGGSIIIVACACLAVCLYANGLSDAKLHQVRGRAEAEKAKLVLDNLKNIAKSERELNEFVAHEVRNPLAAALSACNFATSEISDEIEPLSGKRKAAVLEDLRIVDSSLCFINDLLRNMLDFKKTTSNDVKIRLSSTDVKTDILQVIESLLYTRGRNYSVMTECQDNLIVKTDPLRLKQVLFNLAHNSEKFVTLGFIKIRAVVLEGTVRLYVEDSGPGIPEDKFDTLFAKFQESLDELQQGTGLGLSLCKKLCELLGAEIYHDPSYDCGVEGFKGTRFIIDLNKSPHSLSEPVESALPRTLSTDETDQQYSLPESLSVLFVDDDLILRKLFSRAIKRCAPNWHIQDVASGESAIRIIEEGQSFDMIFMDQYMASVGKKQLRGTEAVRLLRSKGVSSFVCGLSANDMETSFAEAGANSFLMKPLPADAKQLGKILSEMLESRTDLETGLNALSSPTQVSI